MNKIPCFPEFAPIELSMRDELAPFAESLPDGACEFLFAGMFLYRNKYHYAVSKCSPRTYVVSGVSAYNSASSYRGTFFSILGDLPESAQVDVLFTMFDYWKSMPVSLFTQADEMLAKKGFLVAEDRNNFDYLYLRTDLAELRGKKFHKKKNLVNAFESAFTAEVRPLTAESVSDAHTVLTAWETMRGDDAASDYAECVEALSLLDTLSLSGIIVYIDGAPVGFSLGELFAGGKMYCVHFEKAIDTYKGIFQYINQAAAKHVPESVVYINREQDVGDEGLRQAKMTYRPVSFVVKYAVLAAENNDVIEET